MRSGFGWFKSGICAKCGRTSIRKEPSEWKEPNIVETICLGCRRLTTECDCPPIP